MISASAPPSPRRSTGVLLDLILNSETVISLKLKKSMRGTSAAKSGNEPQDRR
uniref:Uncharacterized protein n=1 Tax=Heterorhabditis bacteriophora TaxID=37862 RepID=A0A1I7WLU3_HETBA